MNKILLIDDTPNEPITAKETLLAVLKNLYKNKYPLVVAKNRKAAFKALADDKKRQIGLVLLDIVFKNQNDSGQEIAQALGERYSNLKFILLTNEDVYGQTLSLGNAGRKLEYILKRELKDPEQRKYLFNISEAILTDFQNKKLKLEWNTKTYIMRLIRNNTSITVTLAPAHAKCFDSWLATPNFPVLAKAAGVTSLEAARAFKTISDVIRNRSNGKMWGILTREATGHVTVLISPKNVKISPSKSLAFKPPAIMPCAVTQADLVALEKKIIDYIDLKLKGLL